MHACARARTCHQTWRLFTTLCGVQTARRRKRQAGNATTSDEGTTEQRCQKSRTFPNALPAAPRGTGSSSSSSTADLLFLLITQTATSHAPIFFPVQLVDGARAWYCTRKSVIFVTLAQVLLLHLGVVGAAASAAGSTPTLRHSETMVPAAARAVQTVRRPVLSFV